MSQRWRRPRDATATHARLGWILAHVFQHQLADALGHLVCGKMADDQERLEAVGRGDKVARTLGNYQSTKAWLEATEAGCSDSRRKRQATRARSRISAKVIFCGRSRVARDSADRAVSEAARDWAVGRMPFQ